MAQFGLKNLNLSSTRRQQSLWAAGFEAIYLRYALVSSIHCLFITQQNVTLLSASLFRLEVLHRLFAYGTGTPTIASAR